MLPYSHEASCPIGHGSPFNHCRASTATRTFAVDAATNRLSVANYDPEGNLLAWGGETYAWDALGRMRHHNFPDEVYAYTADGAVFFDVSTADGFGDLGRLV